MTYDIEHRFWLFGYYGYYPAGGMRDFQGSYDTVDAAKVAAKDLDTDHAYVLDTKTGDYDSVPAGKQRD